MEFWAFHWVIGETYRLISFIKILCISLFHSLLSFFSFRAFEVFADLIVGLMGSLNFIFKTAAMNNELYAHLQQ